MAPIKATAGEIAPDGDQPAVCMHVLDMGMETYQGDPNGWKHKVMFFWELEAKMEDGRPFMLSKPYTLSLHPKSSLGPDLSRWLSREFTMEELTDGLDMEQFVGNGCLLEVIHKISGDRGVSARVDRIRALAPGSKVPTGITEAPPSWATDRVASNAEAWAAFRSGKSDGTRKAGNKGDIPF